MAVVDGGRHRNHLVMLMVTRSTAETDRTDRGLQANSHLGAGLLGTPQKSYQGHAGDRPAQANRIAHGFLLGSQNHAFIRSSLAKRERDVPLCLRFGANAVICSAPSCRPSVRRAD